MLTSIILSGTISMVTAPGIPKLGYVTVIGLILLILFKDILSVSELQRKAVETNLNLGIVPLLIVFIATVIYKIAEVL